MCTCTEGIHVHNLVRHTFGKDDLALLDCLWFKGTCTVTGSINCHFTLQSLDRLGHLSITTIARFTGFFI